MWPRRTVSASSAPPTGRRTTPTPPAAATSGAAAGGQELRLRFTQGEFLRAGVALRPVEGEVWVTFKPAGGGEVVRQRLSAPDRGRVL